MGIIKKELIGEKGTVIIFRKWSEGKTQSQDAMHPTGEGGKRMK
jgi:hypothetical protein